MAKSDSKYKLSEYPRLHKYLMSCVASGTAEAVTFPFDLLKSRLQVQGEGVVSGTAQKRLGLFGTSRHVIKNEGFFHLWSGVSPAVVRQFVYSGLRIVIYEEMRHLLVSKPATQEEKKERKFSFTASLIAGASSGAIAQFIASPTDLVKVKLQLDGHRASLGLSRQYRGVFDVIRKVSGPGFHKLWQGWLPNVQRAAIINTADFLTYDGTKSLIVNHTSLTSGQLTTHILASAVTGLSTAVVSTPIDVVKTRIMNQDHHNPTYRSTTHCFVATVKTEGFFALYKGFFPIWLRLSPWVTIFWIVYERLRLVTGAQPF